MRRKAEDDDDDLFVIQKKQSKKTSNKRKRSSRRLKKDESDEDDEYIPQVQQKESSSSEQQSSSEDEKQKKKRQSQVKSQGGKQQKRQPKKAEQQEKKQQLQQQCQQEEQQQTRNDEEFYKLAEQSLPIFMQPEHIRDLEGRRPNEVDYNPSTIEIPNDQYQNLPPMFRQYWNAKKNYLDSIVFFRCGRWIAVLYNDAILIAKMFNRYLGFWGKDRPCVTVYDNQLPLYQRALLEKGHKVIMIEQLEKADIANKEDGEVVRREITQMISRGTLQDLADTETYEQRNLLVLVCQNAPVNLKDHKYVYGVSMVDCTTNQFTFDQFFDDAQSNHLRSVIYNAKPVEVILCRTPPQIEKLFKNICNPTIIISKKDFRECEFIFEQFKIEYMETTKTQNKNVSDLFDGIVVPTAKDETEQKFDIDINKGLYSESKQKVKEEKVPQNYKLSEDYPSLLIELEKQFNYEKNLSNKEDDESTFYSYYYSIQSLYILLCYLRQLIISESVYRRGKFQLLDSNFIHKNNLYLDSQALESLEIFNVNLQTKLTTQGSLFTYLDRCVTPAGKRLLTKWVQSPLQNHQLIIERQACIKELCDIKEKCFEFQKRIKSLPDLERAIIKCFNTIHSHKLKAVPITGGESQGKIKLKEIKTVINNIKQASESFQIFEQDIKSFKSKKLKEILNYKQITSILKQSLEELEKCLIIDGDEPKPVKGLSPEYDQTFDKLTEITEQLDQELEKWRKIFKCKEIVYTHARIRYQLEIPEKYLVGNQKPQELIITSKRQGFQRFQTTFIEEQIHKLRVVEDELSQKLLPFINQYFTKFYSYRKEFFQLISFLSESDCLISLALVSCEQKVSCFPKICKDNGEKNCQLVEAYHPCLLQNKDVEWVPNTIKFDESIDTLLLTGPNMSGKSTLLRLIGVSIILAQIGCAIPAQSFTLSPFDRIFCRLGASDRLLEGKSTFFIELEETKTILDHCTSRSLVIIDELGRGTSTYDGVALASAVLRYLSEKVKPMTLFATHYHILLDEFALFKNIQQCVMKHYQENDQVIFKYKLINGVAEKSFATNVAQIAGIPKEVIKKAKQMEVKITKEESKINKNREILKKFNQIINQLF